jgi:hypothetical protein
MNWLEKWTDGRKTKGGHRLYPTWIGMRSRCYNPKNRAYKNYGAKGVTVCDEWLEDFWNFVDYMDKEHGPKPEGYSLDRIEVTGNYEPGNVRWADSMVQYYNRRKGTNPYISAPRKNASHHGVGVRYDPSRAKPYHAVIDFNGTRKCLGWYDLACEAEAAYKLGYLKFHGTPHLSRHEQQAARKEKTRIEYQRLFRPSDSEQD